MVIVVQPVMAFNMFTTFFLTFMASLGLSTIVVALFIWEPMHDEEDEEDDKKDFYEYKYLDKYDKLKDKRLKETYVENLVNKTITETTPKGEVLLYYDANLQSFVYFSDTKDIPYRYLETVARKYVIGFKCKKLYVDIREELTEGKERVKAQRLKDKESKEKIEEEKEATVFATLKKYNRKGDGGSKSTKKYYVLREKANRYSYRGTLEDYEVQKKEREEKILEESKAPPLDFASFKKMKNEKKEEGDKKNN